MYKNTLKFCLFVLYPTLLLSLVIDSSTERESEGKREREKKRGREREDGNQRLVYAEQTLYPWTMALISYRLCFVFVFSIFYNQIIISFVTKNGFI